MRSGPGKQRPPLGLLGGPGAEAAVPSKAGMAKRCSQCPEDLDGPPRSPPTGTGMSLLQRNTCSVRRGGRCRWARSREAPTCHLRAPGPLWGVVSREGHGSSRHQPCWGCGAWGAHRGLRGQASPRHTCSSCCRAVLSARHLPSKYGVKQNFSRVGDRSCWRLGAAEEYSREMRMPPATMVCRHLSTTASTTAGTGG